MATTSTKKKTASAPSKRIANSSNIGLWLIGASVALVVLVVAVIVINEQRTKSAPVAQPDVPPEWISRTSLGNPDATVVVQTWEDFMCPACQNWSLNVKPLLVEQYVKSGDVRVEFHHLPLSQHEPGASMSALAAECAADQGMFWPYHDKVFQMASVDQQSAVQFEDLTGYARDMGMNEQQFTSCLSSQQYRPAINESLVQAQQLKLSSTPSIIVNGQLLQDSSFPSLQAAIDAQLAAQGQ